MKRAQLGHPDAIDSKRAPASAWIDYASSAASRGDVGELQRGARARLSERSQSPDAADEERVDAGGALAIEAAEGASSRVRLGVVYWAIKRRRRGASRETARE